MALHTPETLGTAAQALSDPHTLLVACLCAAWCGTCREYQPKMEELSARFPQHVFAWIDVEEHPDLIDDEEIEDFPTLLIQDGTRTLFYGPMLPHIGHLERFLDTLGDVQPHIAAAPAVRQKLAA